MRPLAALDRYISAEDPRVARANLIALVLAWNTPFYPLYLIAAGMPSAHPATWLTACSFPVFASVPALTRRWPFGGRLVLAAGGTANTLYCTWLLGEASGTPLFLLGCIMLAGLIFAPHERAALLGAIAAPLLAGLLMHGRYPAALHACNTTTCANLVWLSTFSVALLLGFFALLAARGDSTRQRERG